MYTEQKSGNPTLRWIFFGLAFIVLIIAISSGIKSHKVNHPKKEVNKSKTESVKNFHYVNTFVEVRRKLINLNSKFNDVDTICIKYGQKCTFNYASVAFCVKNNLEQMVCGPANSDPDLPNGNANENLWFKSKYGQSGNLLVIVYERRKQLVQ